MVQFAQQQAGWIPLTLLSSINQTGTKKLTTDRTTSTYMLPAQYAGPVTNDIKFTEIVAKLCQILLHARSVHWSIVIVDEIGPDSNCLYNFTALTRGFGFMDKQREDLA